MKKGKVKSIIATIIFALIYYYVMLPPLNISSPFFWFSLFFVVSIYVVISGVGNLANLGRFDQKGVFHRNPHYKTDQSLKVILKVFAFIFLGIFIVNTASSAMFNSKAYANRISIIEDANFIEDVLPVDFDKVALLDKDSSRKLGDRVMGQLPELVSQFNVSNLYTQNNYNENIERVTPLEYADIFKYFANRKDGITGYIKVNSVTGESTLQRTDKGLKYMRSAYFNDNLRRKLRFDYPTLIFGEKTFEIDDNNNPYWIVPVLKYKGVGLRKEVSDVIIFNPVDGKSTKYKVEDVPSWVDHVYSSELIIEQVNDWGRYKNGFINSVFGQKGVVATTEGYNYLIKDEDVYMTTGITSAVSDESNVGFILTNLRTKETKFYEVPGAEEYSAMDSAMGQVQQMDYKATFPILINLNNKPTYIISLKDAAGLVKMYAFVDLVDYQKVTVTDSSKGIEVAARNYLGSDVDQTRERLEKIIEIKSINNYIIDGNTYLYIIDINNDKYKVNLKVNENILPFIKVRDQLSIVYYKDEINEIISIN